LERQNLTDRYSVDPNRFFHGRSYFQRESTPLADMQALPSQKPGLDKINREIKNQGEK
jgi:hypothetical protein